MKTFHILPRLFVPAYFVNGSHTLQSENVNLKIESTLGFDVTPTGGVKISQPYPNRRYFTGGSITTRHGWLIELTDLTQKFTITFHWKIKIDEVNVYIVEHVLCVTLKESTSKTVFSMDASCRNIEESIDRKPWTTISICGIDDNEKMLINRDIVYSGYPIENNKKHARDVHYKLTENISIPGITMDRLWSIDEFQIKQLHEIRHITSGFSETKAHRRNALVEIPATLFINAVRLAFQIPFGEGSNYDGYGNKNRLVSNSEEHPALKILCDWWNLQSPEIYPLKAGSVMPLVRVTNDGKYYWADNEIPEVNVVEFNSTGKDFARLGDFMLLQFQAKDCASAFDKKKGVELFLPSGEIFTDIDIQDRSEWDEGIHCLEALYGFKQRFPAAWREIYDLALDECYAISGIRELIEP